MKIILLQDVKSQGKKDDVIDVSEGYARNFLLKKGLGVEATSKNLNEIKLKKANSEKVAAEELEAAKEFAEKIKDVKISLKIKAGENGRVFGSVSSKEIAEAAKKQKDFDIDKKKIVINEPIKNLGTYRVPVKLHPKVTGELTVSVEAL